MIRLDPDRLREVRTLEDVLGYLADDLDWPIDVDDLEDATFEWEPDELGIPADRIPTLESLRQLRPLQTDQPWGVFFLEFAGPRLPLTALRRLLTKLVTKKRATSGSLKTWGLDDLLFIITTGDGESVELHFVAFFETDGNVAEIRSLPWRPEQSPGQHLRRLAFELLPHLAWPDEDDSVAEWRAEWRSAFRLRHGAAITSTTRLVDRMATTAARLRDRIAEALQVERGSGPFTTLMMEVKEQLLASVTAPQFADVCAQTLVYGALTSRITDPVAFGASPTLSSVPLANPFLAAFFEQVHDHTADLDTEDEGLEQLVADLKATDVEAILDQFGSTARGGDPVIHFYEEFLQSYDPQMRVDAGAFYTPQAAVQFMVRSVDEVLRSRLGLDLGLADPISWGEIAERLDLDLPSAVDPQSSFVAMLDPATGTGTFLVEWLRQARRSFEMGGAASGWPDHARKTVLPSIHALELMLAPYAVAHLKTALELHEDGIDSEELAIFLTDTLERGGKSQLSLEPDAISVEGGRADAVKANTRVTVCIGNPPYDRVAKDAGGGRVTDTSGGRSLFDDILDPAREHTIFSHHASLYNKFVYFWRWSLWKVFEDRPDLPGVVSLITPSSWLTGPGFLGLRQLIRELADEIWVVDLGGDNRGTRRDENIFAIETPVAITTIVRRGPGDRSTPAVGHYRRIEGTAAEKLAWLAADGLDLDDEDWVDVASGWHDHLVPGSTGDEWSTYPLLTDLFPWQQPGCKFGRTWPIGTSAETLGARWERFMQSDDAVDRARCFYTATSGRNITTQVAGFRRLVDEPVGSPPQPIVRYGFRSFDRQWAFADPRLAKTESPSLWATATSSQVFMTTMPTNSLGEGLAASVSAEVPDLHYFCGRGGKDVLPLYRDGSEIGNVSAEWLGEIEGAHCQVAPDSAPVTVERLFAYAYALLAGSNYTTRFHEELQIPGPRVPVTADPVLFNEAVLLGGRLLYLHTYGERFQDNGSTESALRLDSIRVAAEWTELPPTLQAIRYDHEESLLVVGSGSVKGVSPEVWQFEVSGMQVVKKWLGYRTAKGAGKAASSSSPLDQIRPTEWHQGWTEELLDLLSVLQRTVDLLPTGSGLLEQICQGPLIAAQDLPPIPSELRKPPKGSLKGSLGI